MSTPTAAAAARRVMAESESYSLKECLQRNDLVHSGELLKQSDYFKVWRQRYFVMLRNPPRLLYYYSGKTNAPAKVISLHRAQVSISESTSSGNDRAGFSVHMPTTGVSLYFTSDDPQRIRAWVAAIASLGNSTTTTPRAAAVVAAAAGGPAAAALRPSTLAQLTSDSAISTTTSDGAGAGAGAGVKQTHHHQQHRRAFSSVLTPKHALTPITGRLTPRQEMQLPLYNSRDEVMDALDNHFIIVFLPKTRGGTTLGLHIENIQTRAERITFDAPVTLDGVPCVCTCELDLNSSLAGAITVTVDARQTRILT